MAASRASWWSSTTHRNASCRWRTTFCRCIRPIRPAPNTPTLKRLDLLLLVLVLVLLLLVVLLLLCRRGGVGVAGVVRKALRAVGLGPTILWTSCDTP